MSTNALNQVRAHERGSVPTPRVRALALFIRLREADADQIAYDVRQEQLADAEPDRTLAQLRETKRRSIWPRQKIAAREAAEKA